MGVRQVFSVCGAAALVVCACSSGRAIKSSSLGLPDGTSLVQTGESRITPFDVLEIKVFGVDSLAGSYQVDASGAIKMPLVGIIDAKGYTAFELAKLIEKKLGESYLQDPQVSIRITEAVSQQLTVEGSVSKPGMYPVRGKVSLLQALAVSGGPTEGANVRKVIVFRVIDGKRQVAGFDLVKIRRGEAEDPPVYANDLIVVEGSSASKTYNELLRTVPLIGLFVALS